MSDNNGIKRSKGIIVEGAAAGYDGWKVEWDCAGTADYHEMHQALAAKFGGDFADNWTPKKPKAKQCLRKAVASLSAKEFNVDCLKKGVWVVSLREKDQYNGVGISYNPQLRIWVEDDESENPSFSDSGHDLCSKIEDKFQEIRRIVPAENVRVTVKDFFKRECASVTTRRAGGVEYVNKKFVEKFGNYANVIGSVTDTDFTVSEVFHGPNSIAGLVKHITREAKKVIENAKEDMIDGKGKRAMGNRALDLAAQESTLEMYAEILGETFDDLADTLDATRTECVMAMHGIKAA